MRSVADIGSKGGPVTAGRSELAGALQGWLHASRQAGVSLGELLAKTKNKD
jgi:hypothetical protein